TGCTRELVEGQQTKGVSHDHAHSRSGKAFVLGIPATAEHHRERGQAEVRLGLTTTGREEEEVDDLAISRQRIGQSGEIEEDEGELERPPPRLSFVEALLQGPRDRSIGEPESV